MKTSQLLDAAFLERVQTDRHTYGYPFVTISRQAGAGGHSLAEAILTLTQAHGQGDLFYQWRIFDEEISEALSRDPSLKISLHELLTEAYNGPVSDLFREIVGQQTSHYTVARRTFELVETVARFGKVVLVGRAGNCITRSLPGGIHLRLIAPPDCREKNMVQRFAITPDEARRLIAEQDHNRSRLVKDFFDRDIGDPALYDRVWDTEETSIETIAADALERIKSKAAEVGRT